MTFAAFGCSCLQSHPLEIADCKIVALHTWRVKQGSDKAEEKGDWPCFAAIAVVAVGCSAVVGTWRSSGIEGWQTRRAYLAGKESQEVTEKAAMA